MRQPFLKLRASMATYQAGMYRVSLRFMTVSPRFIGLLSYVGTRVAGRGLTTCPLDDGCVVLYVACIGCVDLLAFDGASSFNGDLSSWDVSSVTSLERSRPPLHWSFVIHGRASGWSGSNYVSFG